MKKIIQIGGNLRRNGISSFIMTLYRQLHRDCQFIVVNTATGQEHYREEILSLGGKVYDIPVAGRGFLRAIRQARAIRKIIRQEKPDVVHAHYYSNNGLYLRQAYKERVPVRISHCHQANSKITPGKRIAKWISRKMTKEYATHEFACSEEARRFLYGARGEVLYNAIDYEAFSVQRPREALLEQYGLSPDKQYFIFVGRFVPQKNVAFLLQLCKAFRAHDEIGFLFVGHGKLQEEIEAFIQCHELRNLTLFPANSNVAELLALSRALLLPSIYEGLAIVLIEAQAVGIPCLASDAITQEAQLGGVSFIPLQQSVWQEQICILAKQSSDIRPRRASRFDAVDQAALLRGIYENIDAEEWIRRGKEYAIGSKRFYRSKELSLACFSRAAALGNIRGKFYYALGCFEGNGIQKDKERAQLLVKEIVQAVEIAAQRGEADLLVILGDMYSFGLGKEQDFVRAFQLYSLAAARGNLEAMCDLGYMYLVGQGVEMDKEKSLDCFKKSADMGYVHSMRDVGQNYLHGDGAPADPKRAVFYFKLASEHNYSHGTCDLAYCYLHGIGVEQDHERAKELFLLGLRQDPERTMRDLFAYAVDILALTQRNELCFLKNTTIKEIGVQNTYADTLCVSERIEYVDAAYLYNSTVKKIFVEKDNQTYCAAGGVLFSKDKRTLFRFPPCATEHEYIVPHGVETIGEYAFQNARNLQKITLPDTVKEIRKSAFDDCKQLRALVLPSGLRTIGAWAFHGCDQICEFQIPQSVERIGKYAFGSCEHLIRIQVHADNANFCSVDGNLFTKDRSILLQYAIGKSEEAYVLPDETDCVAFRAFSDAYHLRYIDLNRVQAVEDKAFYYATSLEKVVCCGEVRFGENVFGHTPDTLQREVRK